MSTPKLRNQIKSQYRKTIVRILWGILLLAVAGAVSCYFSRIFFAEAIIPNPLPPPTSPPLSCTGCHDFQAGLFTKFDHHHPNAIASSQPTDMVTKVNAIRQDCCACHNYLLNHTRGIVMLRDPDPLDAYSYNGDPILTNNFCLSCHDRPNDPLNPPVWFSVNGLVSPGRIIAPLWSLPCGHAVNRRRNLRCLDCHKYHGSNFKSMLLLEQPRLCYMNGCHPEKAREFDIANPSHHHVEGVLLGGVPSNVIACCDCHNPHHDTTMENGHPICDPYSKADLYPALPLPQVTPPAPPANLLLPFNVLGLPYFTGNTTAAGFPAVNLFCCECHAPNIFIPPNPLWPGAPNISFELNNKEYAAGFTVSNFFYPHRHLVGGPCKDCHISGGLGGIGSAPQRILNGHFTHLRNASCTYCHDPHGTPGTFAGNAVTGNAAVGIVGVQRAHLLKEWLLADSTAVQPLPLGGGYSGAGIYTTTTITKVDGASSCFINDPGAGCHNVARIHKPAVISPASVCNQVPCHFTFRPALLKKGLDTGVKDTIPPEPPK